MDRYATILTCRRILLFLSVSWVLVLASSLPPLLGVCSPVTSYRPGQQACLPDWTGSKVGGVLSKQQTLLWCLLYPGVPCYSRGDGGCLTNIPDDWVEPSDCPDRQVSPVQDRQRHIQDDIHPPQHDGQWKEATRAKHRLKEISGYDEIRVIEDSYMFSLSGFNAVITLSQLIGTIILFYSPTYIQVHFLR